MPVAARCPGLGLRLRPVVHLRRRLASVRVRVAEAEVLFHGIRPWILWYLLIS